MPDIKTLVAQTLAIRSRCVELAEACADRADVIPAGWNNNMRWHIGHLVQTPRLLTLGLLGEDLGVPDEFKGWFRKGTTPREWGNAEIPSLAELNAQIEPTIHFVVEKVADRMDQRFREPYPTSAGALLSTPGEALLFSFAHDGIHLGSMLALRRALNAR